VTYRIEVSPSAARALEVELPEKIAVAVIEFIYGPLAENPQRVGKQLEPPLYPRYSARRGEYRVLYDILDEAVVVRVIVIGHRRDAYR
jgi:mRNA interferase RelE/StbE